MDRSLRGAECVLQDIAGDPKHLGAEIGGFAVLHTWGQQLHHHPHLHCVLPAGGLAPDGTQWIPCRPHFFLPVRVLSRRFRHLYLAGLAQTYAQGHLTLTGRCRKLAAPTPWQHLLATLRDKEWVVYAKEPLHAPRGVPGGARGRVSGLPARAHATGQNGVSTASSVGPHGAHAWPGHLIEE